MLCYARINKPGGIWAEQVLQAKHRWQTFVFKKGILSCVECKTPYLTCCLGLGGAPRPCLSLHIAQGFSNMVVVIAVRSLAIQWWLVATFTKFWVRGPGAEGGLRPDLQSSELRQTVKFTIMGNYNYQPGELHETCLVNWFYFVQLSRTGGKPLSFQYNLSTALKLFYVLTLTLVFPFQLSKNPST